MIAMVSQKLLSLQTQKFLSHLSLQRGCQGVDLSNCKFTFLLLLKHSFGFSRMPDCGRSPKPKTLLTSGVLLPDPAVLHRFLSLLVFKGLRKSWIWRGKEVSPSSSGGVMAEQGIQVENIMVQIIKDAEKKTEHQNARKSVHFLGHRQKILCF